MKYLSVCEEIFKWHSDYVLWDFLKYRMLIQLLLWFITSETYLFQFCCVPVPWTQPFCYAHWKLWISFLTYQDLLVIAFFLLIQCIAFWECDGHFLFVCLFVFCIGSNYALWFVNLHIIHGRALIHKNPFERISFKRISYEVDIFWRQSDSQTAPVDTFWYFGVIFWHALALI